MPLTVLLVIGRVLYWSAARGEPHPTRVPLAWFLTALVALPIIAVSVVDIDLSDDEEEQEVIGESHYQPALAEVSNLVDGVVRRRDVVAVLVPEPENRYDRNAVRIDVFGRPVGYIPRDDAAEIAPVRLALHRQGLIVASQAEIVGGGRGHSGDTLSFGIRLQMLDHYDWPQKLQGAVTVRTAASLPPTPGIATEV